MDNRIYGYVRVSTREQNEDRQIETLTKFGVPEHNIIIDKASGKDTEREGYQYLKRQILRNGDTGFTIKHKTEYTACPFMWQAKLMRCFLWVLCISIFHFKEIKQILSSYLSLNILCQFRSVIQIIVNVLEKFSIFRS